MTPPATPAHVPHITPHVAHAPVFAQGDNGIHNDALDVDEAPDMIELHHDSSEDEDNLDAHHNQNTAACGVSAREDTTSMVPLALRELGDYNKLPEKEAEEDGHTNHVDDVASRIMKAPKDLPKSSHAEEQTSKIVKSPKDLPKPFTTIEYWHDAEDWIQGDVISINMKKKHNVSIWRVSNGRNILLTKSEEEVEEIYFRSATNSSRFLEAKQAEIESGKNSRHTWRFQTLDNQEFPPSGFVQKRWKVVNV